MAEISNIKKEIKKYRYAYASVFLIFVGSAFLRVYNFGNWLILKSDQARDALILNQVQLNGISSLPLVGPQVGGTEFRLGPIFYYFQFISAKIFGFSPESLAYPDLIFGILTIPLIFLLVKKFFDFKISIFLTMLGGVSLILATFSRFGWNPNSLPFFTFLFAYSFLKIIEKEKLKRWWWLFLVSFSLGVIAQLHLFAILSLGLGVFLFSVITKFLNWKEIILVLSVFLFLHTPLLINELRTAGENMRFFSQAKEEKEEKENNHAIYEKFFRAYQENSRAMWIIATGNQNPDIISTKGMKLVCNKKCKENIFYSLGAMILFGFSSGLIFYNWKRCTNLVEKERLFFIILWMASFFIFSIPLAYQMEIRFYLGVIPIFFILLGYVLKYFLEINKNILFKYVIWLICLGIIFLNSYITFRYLKELNTSQLSNEKSNDDLRFGGDSKVTLGQLRDIAQEAEIKLNKENFLIISGETHYVKAMYYLLSVEHGFRGCYLRGEIEKLNPSFNQLIIRYNKIDDKKYNKLEKNFGTLKASFIKADYLGEDDKIPEGCINY